MVASWCKTLLSFIPQTKTLLGKIKERHLATRFGEEIWVLTNYQIKIYFVTETAEVFFEELAFWRFDLLFFPSNKNN